MKTVQSIHQTRYQDIQITYVFESASRNYAHDVIAIATQVRKLKSEHQLSLKTPLTTMQFLHTIAQYAQCLAQHDQLIRGVTSSLMQSMTNSRPTIR